MQPTEPSKPAQPDSAPGAAYADEMFANVVSAVRALKHPGHIGAYRIIEVIGEGGMGVVYKAEQRVPVQRIVAIKSIKLGMDTREVIARFESERQALALMDHPHVAKVLDAGASIETGGRPYFVMEYVAGEPINRFADRNKLTMRQRLELFMQACDAVQHAHQKAIIHRDLKPSNILASFQDGKPWVKVIDFGVAKAVSRRLTERTFFTETGQLVGTPEYMAPEQAEAAFVDVDTRTDVYSLGVVLYELLSGALPFDARTLRSGGYNEIQRIIREVDPPRPSTKLSSLGNNAEEVARCRQMPLDSLEKQLKSELEWIPLMAMRKERSQRYSTARELAEDIANYLENRPLRAGPESASYRARKFFRRNKTGVAASAAMLLLLVLGIIATTWQAVRATHAEREAVREKKQADVQRTRAEDASENLQAVNNFLTQDLLASAAPEVTRGREMPVREAVDRAAETVGERFKNRPLTEAAVRSVLADTYDALGVGDKALENARIAMAIQRREHGPDHEDTLIATQQLGNLLAGMNKHEEAEPLLREVAARSERLRGPDDAVTVECMLSLAKTLRMQEKFAEAEPLLRRGMEADRKRYGPQSAELATSMNNLAVLLNTQGRSTEAEALYREALEIKKKVLGEDHPSYLSSLNNLARVLEAQGKLPEAETMLRHVMKEKQRVLKDDHPATLIAQDNLASILMAEGKLEEAEALYRDVLARRQRVLGADDRDTLQSMHNLGAVLTKREKYDEAERVHKIVIEARQRTLGEKSYYTVNSKGALATVYEKQGRWDASESLFAEVCRPDVIAAQTPVVAAGMIARYGLCLAKEQKFKEAEPVLVDARKRISDLGQSHSDRMRAVLEALATIYAATNRATEAAGIRAELSSLAATSAPTTSKTPPPTSGRVYP